MPVVFEDYSIQCKTALRSKAIAFLNEIGGEIRSMTQRNSRKDTGQTAGLYSYVVDEGQLAVHVGSNYDNAIWEEFGTGEFAENGNGRKGYWVYVKGSSKKKTSSGKNLTLGQAKKAVAILRSQGLNAYYTKGKTANHPLLRAFQSSQSIIQSQATKIFTE